MVVWAVWSFGGRCGQPQTDRIDLLPGASVCLVISMHCTTPLRPPTCELKTLIILKDQITILDSLLCATTSSKSNLHQSFHGFLPGPSFASRSAGAAVCRAGSEAFV